MSTNTGRRRARPLLLFSLTLLAACGGDSLVGLEGDPLSEAEIQAVFDAFANTFSSLSSSQPSAVAGGPMAITVSQSFDTTAPCVQGGAIAVAGSVSGTVDDQTFASDLDFELVLAPDGCAVATEGGVVTIDGAPDVRLVVSSAFSETSLSMSGTERGGIRFTSSDGRSGTCPIDVSFETTVDLTTDTAQQQVSGTVCGVSASAFSVIGDG